MASTATHLTGSDTLSRFAPAVFAMLQILTPMLPQLGIGQSIGEQSDSVRTLITPAGWAFSIWGPLYAGSIIFAIYQALPAQRSSEFLAAVRWPAAGAFFGNAVWAIYTQMFGLSAISAAIILFTLVCLLTLYSHFARWRRPFSAGERWCTVLPLSALASWLTAASIVNISAALRFHGVDAGDASPLIAAAMVLVGGGIAGLALARGQGNPAYALVFLWALSAIYASGGQQADMVAVATAVAALLVIGATVLGLRAGGMSHWFRRSGRAQSPNRNP